MDNQKKINMIEGNFHFLSNVKKSHLLWMALQSYENVLQIYNIRKYLSKDLFEIWVDHIQL